MTLPLLETAGFAASVIDSLASPLCVVDRHGVITVVNEAWRKFSRDRPAASAPAAVGAHYLDVCRRASGPGSEEAIPFAEGLESVLAGTTDNFRIEYPCHSPTELQWFQARVTPLRVPGGGAVISHLNITDRRLLEQDLTRLAETDILTGLPNRRFFFQAANQEVERVRRFATPATIVLIDIDHFKAINDTFGHATGDSALRLLAEACRRAIRQIDVLARIGGEEFALLLPETDGRGGIDVAEKLRQAISAVPVENEGNTIGLTASFGVAEMQPTDETADAALARADSALYAAKHAGRNGVKLYVAPPRAAAIRRA